MLSALIIVFREVLEAGLIVGVTMAATAGMPRRAIWITGAAVAGVVGAGVVALSIEQLSGAFDGVGQDVFNAGVLAIAAAMLLWHNVWMASHGRQTAAALKDASHAAREETSSLFSLALVVALAILREGSEVVLFLYGIAASEPGSGASMAAGGALGLALGALAGGVTYAGLVALPVRLLFKATTALIALVAAGMAAQSIAFLEQAGVMMAGQALWDTSGFMSEGSLAGRTLHTLIGYSDQPTPWQAVAYALLLAANVGLVRIVATRTSSVQRKPSSAAA